MCSSNSIRQKTIRYLFFNFFFRVADIPPRRREPHGGPRLEKILQDRRIPGEAGNSGSPEIEIPEIATTKLGGNRISGDSQPEFPSRTALQAPYRSPIPIEATGDPGH